MNSVIKELEAQWRKPDDIFSLLLLVGGDVVQKSIARLFGVQKHLFPQGPKIYLTPVAFSFGWVAYAFIALAAILRDQRLMPAPDANVLVVNCDSGYVRSNNSWLLGRLLRDQEHRALTTRLLDPPPEDSTGEVSLRIDVFTAEKREPDGVRPGLLWWVCWSAICFQFFVASAFWHSTGDWSAFMITAAGTLLALVTAGLPEWAAEKWPADRRNYGKNKNVVLTRGNGHSYAMLVISKKGTWDLEKMASARIQVDRWLVLPYGILAALWTILLITATGLKSNTWPLLIIGGIGMLQNILTAAWKSSPEDFDMILTRHASCSTITGYQYKHEIKKDLWKGKWKNYTEEDARIEFNEFKPDDGVRDVMGALMELEKRHEKAGAALLPVFFPGSVQYESTSLVTKREELFWKHASTHRPTPQASNTQAPLVSTTASDPAQGTETTAADLGQGAADRVGDQGQGAVDAASDERQGTMATANDRGQEATRDSDQSETTTERRGERSEKGVRRMKRAVKDKRLQLRRAFTNRD